MGEDYEFDLAPIDQIFKETCGPAVYDFEFVTEDASHVIKLEDDKLVIDSSYMTEHTVIQWYARNDYW